MPDAAKSATPGTSVLLLGVLDKVGTYGMIRFCIALFPDASKTFTPLIIVLSVISILYGAFMAIGQRDIKGLIAFTSISHFGFITMGIFAMTTQGMSGATLYMVNHMFGLMPQKYMILKNDFQLFMPHVWQMALIQLRRRFQLHQHLITHQVVARCS